MSICHGETKAENLHFYQTPAPVNLLAGRFLVSTSGAALKCQVRSLRVCPQEKKESLQMLPISLHQAATSGSPPNKISFSFSITPLILMRLFFGRRRGGVKQQYNKTRSALDSGTIIYTLMRSPSVQQKWAMKTVGIYFRRKKNPI